MWGELIWVLVFLFCFVLCVGGEARVSSCVGFWEYLYFDFVFFDDEGDFFVLRVDEVGLVGV